jgi:hypothetical protein
MRFDWVTVQEDTEFVPCQICCLWELRAIIRGKQKSVLLFSAIKTKNILRRQQRIGLFQKRCYDLYGKKNIFRIITDFVDSIMTPAYVVPSTLHSIDYFESSLINRSSVAFYYIPYQFFFRDDWGDTNVNLTKTKLEAIQYSRSSREFSLNEVSVVRENDKIESRILTRQKRRRLTSEILTCIRANENDYEDVADEEIIMEGVLRAR